MDPNSVVTTTNPDAPSQTLQQLQGQAAQGAHAVGQTFASAYSATIVWFIILSVLITIALLIGIVYFAIETGWWENKKLNFKHVILKSNISREHGREAWHHVQEAFFKGSENDLKVAIMDADKLLNEALREAGIMGTNLGDRLKKANNGQVPNINDLWQAHRLRNQIAHEPNFKLKRDLAERALSIYQVALKNLGIFDGE